MDPTSFIWLASALIVVLIGAVVWWRQRQRLARLQNLLRDAEDSRLELFDEAQTLRRQLHAGAKAPLPAPATAASAPADVARRRALLDHALDAAAPAASAGWLDTQPMGAVDPSPNEPPGFQPTQPAPLATRPAELMGDSGR